MEIYHSIQKNKKAKNKMFALLIDPDKQEKESLVALVKEATDAEVDLFFVGGSLLKTDTLDLCVSIIKANTKIPVVLFPGNAMQVNTKADAILFLSLISGRNPEMLIGKQVISAPILKNSNLEIMSTGYMLIDSGKQTTASYMSNTTPIPYEKDDVATATAMAGNMLGLKLIFMDGGSGALNCISTNMISAVKNAINIPLIIGGGISSPEQACKICKAGADIVVIGNAVEKNPNIIRELSEAIHNL